MTRARRLCEQEWPRESDLTSSEEASCQEGLLMVGCWRMVPLGWGRNAGSGKQGRAAATLIFFGGVVGLFRAWLTTARRGSRLMLAQFESRTQLGAEQSSFTTGFTTRKTITGSIAIARNAAVPSLTSAPQHSATTQRQRATYGHARLGN